VLGWSGHEIQWGRDGRMLSVREDEINRAFTAPSLEDALPILRKYGVTYVFIGTLERAKYGNPALQKFETGLPAEFKSGNSAVYRVPLELRAQ
jgi:uncharacterized membrane protein